MWIAWHESGGVRWWEGAVCSKSQSAEGEERAETEANIECGVGVREG